MSMVPSPSQLFPVILVGGPISVAAAGTLTAPGTTTYLAIPAGIGTLRVVALSGAITGSTVVVDVKQALDAAGTGAKSLNASLIAMASTDGGKAFSADVPVDSFDIANGFSFFKVTATVNGGTSAVLGLAVEAGAGPHPA